MYKEFGIKEEVISLAEKINKDLLPIFDEIDKNCELNSLKVLKAFNKYNVSDMHFNSTTGYGYGDVGRDTIENIFSEVLGAEDSLVRGQFISGTHALTVALFAFLRPNDTMLSICGKPYDTLDTIIGFNDNPSSLKAFNIDYKQIDLIDNNFDYNNIKDILSNNKIKLIENSKNCFAFLFFL